MYIDYDVMGRLYPGYLIYGPYRGDDGRNRVVFKETIDGLTTKTSKSFSMSYARAIMTSQEGRILSPDEEVDHRDDDHTNDHPRNLRIVDRDEHDIKSRVSLSKRQSTRKLVTCPCCQNVFMCKLSRIELATKKNKKPCCTRSCASSLYGSNQHM